MNLIIKTIAYTVILFYTTGQPYDIFSNTTAVPVEMNLNGTYYQARSSEALFQGLKGLGHRSRNKRAISLIKDRHTSFRKLRQLADHSGFNRLGSKEIYNQSYQGHTVKEEVMYQILLAKATQHLEICKALLETGSSTIIENSFVNPQYQDEFWGNGRSKKGHNALGKAWMRVRDTLNRELGRGGIRKRIGISDDLAKILGHRFHQLGSEYDGTFIVPYDLVNTQSCTLVSQLKIKSITSKQKSKQKGN